MGARGRGILHIYGASLFSSTTVVVGLLALSLISALLVTSRAHAAKVVTYGFLSQWGEFGNGNGQFKLPGHVALDGGGNVYVTDFFNNRVQKFDSSGQYLDQWGTAGSGDGQFKVTAGLAVDVTGNVYVVDSYNHRVQKFNSGGQYLYQWGAQGDGEGKFEFPNDIAIDTDGYVYVVDQFNNRVQKFSPNAQFLKEWETVETDAVNGSIKAIATDAKNNVYVADSANHVVQKFNSKGDWIAVWGTSGSGDGLFNVPAGIEVDSNNDVYVSDSGNSRIQKFTAEGDFILKWGSKGIQEGQFQRPNGIVVSKSGAVYVADPGSQHVLKFAPVVALSLPKTYPGLIDIPSAPKPEQPTVQQVATDKKTPDQAHLGSSTYERACNLKITSPRLKLNRSGSARVPVKKLRRLFTHGVKGYIDWGQVNGREVVCEGIKIALLEKRRSSFYIPGTGTKVSSTLLTSNNFSGAGIRFLSKKRVGKLKWRYHISQRRTKISFKDFNRSSKLGGSALENLRKRRYRARISVIYSATVEGVTVFKKVKLSSM